jgi:orotidine-5'-phosphate decarboxylase
VVPAFIEKLKGAAARADSLLCVGLDPDPARLPAGLDVVSFCREIVAATHDLVCCYKPNLAFFEALGDEGTAALRATLAAVPAAIPVIGDAKRGDIGSTSEAYAGALFDFYGFDACTVNAYGGRDSIEPFLAHGDRGVFIWCRSSNPGAADLQDLLVQQDGATMPLWRALLVQAQGWNERGNLGIVMGATSPGQIADARAVCGAMPILAPGVGAQAGDLEATVRLGVDAAGGGLIVSASRSVLYASPGGDFAEAARIAADHLREEINRHRSAALTRPEA